jgi:hypothetical protein
MSVKNIGLGVYRCIFYKYHVQYEDVIVLLSTRLCLGYNYEYYIMGSFSFLF